MSAKPRWQLYGPDFGAVLEREKPIRGRVFDADTGTPRANVTVHLTRRDGGDLLPVVPSAMSDKDGRYELRGARKAGSYMVEVAADTTAGYMPAQASSGDTTGYEPVTLDVRVKKGVVITGRLTDKETAKPVAGWVLVGVPAGNKSAKDYPEFNSSSGFPIQHTDAEGRFRVVAIPGPVLLFGCPNDMAAYNRYRPPMPDPKYPQFFKTFGDHTAYFVPGGAFTPLQGRYCKVVEAPAVGNTVTHDIAFEPAEAKKAEPKK